MAYNSRPQQASSNSNQSNVFGTRYGAFQATGSFIVNPKFVSPAQQFKSKLQTQTVQIKEPQLTSSMRIQQKPQDQIKTQSVKTKEQNKKFATKVPLQSQQEENYDQNPAIIKLQNSQQNQGNSQQKKHEFQLNKDKVKTTSLQMQAGAGNSQIKQNKMIATQSIDDDETIKSGYPSRLIKQIPKQQETIQSNFPSLKQNNYVQQKANEEDEDATLVFQSRPSAQQTLNNKLEETKIYLKTEEEDETMIYQKPISRDPSIQEENGMNQIEMKLTKDIFKETNYTRLLQNQHITLTYTEAQFFTPDQQQESQTFTQTLTSSSRIVLNKNQIDFKKQHQDSKEQTKPPIKQLKASNGQVKSDKLQEKKCSNNIEPVLGVYKHRSDEQQHVSLVGGVYLMKHQGGDVIVNRKIYNHFGPNCVEKIAINQTLIYGEECKSRVSNKLETVEEIITFLKLSKQFKHIENIEKLAEGGEAVVYKLKYLGYEEVVIKVPKVKSKNQMNLKEHGEAILEGFEDLVHESQLIKTIYHEDYTVEVKEEIVEIDLKSKELKRYLVIVERARFSLYDLYSFKAVNNSTIEKNGLWFNTELRNKNLEHFSVYKFFYYFYQTAKAIDYLHSRGIIYSDMKPQNLLVMRNQKVKIGDFGVSILMSSNQEVFQIKGLSPSWCIPEIQNRFNKLSMAGQMRSFYLTKWHADLLKQNDIYALCLTFSQELVDFLIQSSSLSADDRAVVKFFGQIGIEMALLRTTSLQEGIKRMEHLLKDSFTFYYTLINILRREKKYDAAYQLGVTLEKQVQGMTFEKDQMLLIYLNIQKLMCQFTVSQGNYVQAQKHLDEFRRKMIQSQQIISQSINPEFTQFRLFGLIESAKILIYQGSLEQGSEIAAQAFELYKLKGSELEQFKFEMLELKALVLMSYGRNEQALPLYVEYSKQLELLDDKNDVQDQAHTYNKIGEVFYRLGDLISSLKFYEKAEALILKDLGENHPMILNTYKVKGSIYLAQNSLEKAEQMFDKALEMCLTLYGEKNIQTAETYRQIGDLLNKRQLTKAIYYYEKAIAIYEFLFKKDNIHLVVIYNNMAGLYERQGKYELAEAICLQSLQIKMKLNQAEDDDVAKIYQNLSQIAIQLKDQSKTIENIRKAYKIREKCLGIQNHLTITTLLTYIKLLSQLLRDREALQEVQDAISSLSDHLGSDDPMMLQVVQLLGQLYVKTNALSSAELIFKQVLDCVQSSENKEIRENELILMRCHRDLGVVYELQNDTRAVTLYEQCIKYIQSILDRPNERISEASSYEELLVEMFGFHKSLGGLLLRQRQLHSGVKYLQSAIDMLVKYRDKNEMMKSMSDKFFKLLIDMKQQCEAHINNMNQLQKEGI